MRKFKSCPLSPDLVDMELDLQKRSWLDLRERNLRQRMHNIRFPILRSRMAYINQTNY